MPCTRRRRYEASFKLQVVKFAKESNNCAAARKFGIAQKMVSDWRKHEQALMAMPRKKCAMRSGVPLWPELENSVAEWIIEQRQKGLIVSRSDIKAKALQWARLNRYLSNGFNATSSWCSRFMKRKQLVMRQKTKTAQQLPVDLKDQLQNFKRCVANLRRDHGFMLSAIGNMDETPIYFDMVGARTVENKGVKSVAVRTTGHEKSRFTVVLSCLADGRKLKPMVIFKRKTMPKEKFPSGVYVHCHRNGWMDEEGVKLWIDNIWRKRPGQGRNKSLLVWDSFRSHVTKGIKSYLKECNVETAVIPGGLTSVLQPIDVCLNKPFKDYMRQEWSDWMANGQRSYTRGGRLRAPSLQVVCGFVINAWRRITPETVINSFRRCSISGTLDNTEDETG